MEYGGSLIQMNFNYVYSSENLFKFFKTSYDLKFVLGD